MWHLAIIAANGDAAHGDAACASPRLSAQTCRDTLWALLKAIGIMMHTGEHDGAAEGKRYFTCKAMHGIYASYQDVGPSKSTYQKAMGALGSIGRAVSRSPERSDKVKEHRNAFMAWNAMDMDAEAQHHEQAATQERVEAILRAAHPSAAQLPNEISVCVWCVCVGASRVGRGVAGGALGRRRAHENRCCMGSFVCGCTFA